ncbi:MAG: AbrB/MazE/SpoVT family DNA-binding domain-containing protein [Candidatus Hydrothermarchaeota archaeon]
MIVAISKLSKKGQITLPKDLRDLLGLKAGDKVVFEKHGDKIVLRKETTEKLSSILMSQKKWSVSSLDFQKKVREEWI